MTAKDKANELSITRIYNAKVEQVWDAWVDPKQVAQWWGPRGFTLTTKRKDVRTGGDWLYTMHGPDGVDWPNHTKFVEVEKYKRLVYDHGGFEDSPPMFRVSVLFSEEKGKTKMEMTMSFASAEVLEQSKKVIKNADGNSTWDRLAEFLERESTGKEKFVINRSFEVDCDTIFSAFYRMPFGDSVIYGNVHYLEVKRPDRLVYMHQFANADGSPGRHPLASQWPQSLLTTVTFTEEGIGRTRVTLDWEVSGEWTQAEMDMFVNGKKSMSQGWGESFDKLEEYLRST